MKPENREAAQRRLADLWKDPAFREARKKAIEEAKERNRTTGETSRRKREAMKEFWANPTNRAKMMARVRKKKESGKYHDNANTLAALRGNIEVEERRLKRLREYHAENRGLRIASMAQINRKRRGFDVPANLWKEYQYLLKTKKMRAREAGILLGLVRE